VVLRQREQKIYTLPPECPHESLTERICLRTVRGRFEYLELEIPHAPIKLVRENTIPVMEEEAIGVVSRERFTQLLQRPWGRGMCRYVRMQNPACGMFHEYEHVEQAKGRGDHDAEITGHNALGMSAHKRPPTLGGYAGASTVAQMCGHGLPHRAGGHPQTQL